MLGIIILLGFLWFWFLGCIITWKFGNILLVEGMGIKSAEFIMMVLYSSGILTYILWGTVGRYILLSVLFFWLIIQFFCHEFYTIFGASDQKLKGYNECFRSTVKIFPVSEKRLIPDMYHIILHILILLNFFLLVFHY